LAISHQELAISHQPLAMKGLLTLTAAAMLVVVAAAQSQAPATPAGNSANGKRLYEADGCYQCHGFAGQGGRDGPRIAATALNAPALIRYVRRPSGAMPAFTEKVLSEQELTDIYAYLKTFPAAKAAKDIPLLDQLRDK
jgi:mono/diheme cytochrome c family protein